MASVKDLINAGFNETLVKMAVDEAGFVRTAGRGGLDLNAKGVAKVVKVYTALLAKLSAKIAKFDPDKLDYSEKETIPKAKAEKKAPAKAAKAKAKPADDEDEDDEVEADDQDDDVEEADDEDDDE